MPLGSVASVERRGLEPDAIATGTIYVGLENIKSGGELDSVKPVDYGQLASMKFIFSSSHVLYGKLRPYLAKIAAPEFDGVCSTDILPVLPGPELDRRYLMHFLRQPEMVELATARSSGANLPRLNAKELERFEIPLPPLPEQRRIAAILDHADALRAKRREAIARLDELSQSIFIDMFGDPVGNPSEWLTFPLGTLSVDGLRNGAYFSKERYSGNGVEMVHMGDVFYNEVHRGGLRRVSATIDEISRYGVDSTDLLVARRSLNYGGAAKPCLVPGSDEPLLFESSLIRIRPDRCKVTVNYLFHFLNSRSFRMSTLPTIVTGTTIFGVSQNNLAKVLVPVPPMELQQEFGGRLQRIGAVEIDETTSTVALESLFSSLQSRAFRGEL